MTTYYTWIDMSIGIIAVQMNDTENPFDKLISYMNEVSPFVKGMEAVRDGDAIIADVPDENKDTFDYDYYPEHPIRAIPCVMEEKDLVYKIFHSLYCRRYNRCYMVDSPIDWFGKARESFIQDHESFFVRRMNYIISQYMEQAEKSNHPIFILDGQEFSKEEIFFVLERTRTDDPKIIEAQGKLTEKKYEPADGFDSYYSRLIYQMKTDFHPVYKKSKRGRRINTGKYVCTDPRPEYLYIKLDTFNRNELYETMA